MGTIVLCCVTVVITILVSIKNYNKNFRESKSVKSALINTGIWITKIELICAMLVVFWEYYVYFPSHWIYAYCSVKIVACIIITGYMCITQWIRRNKRLRNRQREYYLKENENVKQSLESVKKIRHDLKNSLMGLQAIAEKQHNLEILQYLDKITKIANAPKACSNSGNLVIDRFIDYKLSSIAGDIDVKININVPCDLVFDEADLVVLLGNLIDNAIEALDFLKDNKWIELQMKYDKGVFILEISNSFDGTIYKQGKKFISRKSNSAEHGYGLQCVREIVDKYQGKMEIGTEKNIFNIMIILYI